MYKKVRRDSSQRWSQVILMAPWWLAAVSVLQWGFRVLVLCTLGVMVYCGLLLLDLLVWLCSFSRLLWKKWTAVLRALISTPLNTMSSTLECGVPASSYHPASESASAMLLCLKQSKFLQSCSKILWKLQKSEICDRGISIQQHMVLYLNFQQSDISVWLGPRGVQPVLSVRAV